MGVSKRNQLNATKCLSESFGRGFTRTPKRMLKGFEIIIKDNHEGLGGISKGAQQTDSMRNCRISTGVVEVWDPYKDSRMIPQKILSLLVQGVSNVY